MTHAPHYDPDQFYYFQVKAAATTDYWTYPDGSEHLTQIASIWFADETFTAKPRLENSFELKRIP